MAVPSPNPQPAHTSKPMPPAAHDGGLADVLQAMDASKGRMPKPFK